MKSKRSRARVERGQLRRRRRLGTEAVYRVLEIQGAFVRVEVIRAPGLASGDVFRFAIDTVTEMEVCSEPDTPAVEHPGRTLRLG